MKIERELTDNEIIKAFKQCGSGSVNSCQICPYKTTPTRCNVKKMHEDIENLIRRLQIENAKLSKKRVR